MREDLNKESEEIDEEMRKIKEGGEEEEERYKFKRKSIIIIHLKLKFVFSVKKESMMTQKEKKLKEELI